MEDGLTFYGTDLIWVTYENFLLFIIYICETVIHIPYFNG